MKLFNTIVRELEAYEARRELVIKAGREILRDAKRVIFLCHDGKLDEAKRHLASLTRIVGTNEKKFKKPLSANRGAFPLYSEGSWCAAVEEYLEAWFLLHFLTHKKIVAPTGIAPKADVYIGALADSTGELVRLAVLRGARKEVKTIEQFRGLTARVVEFMLPLYLTGSSRQKFDAAKKNLKRIEEIVYEVRIRS